MPYDTERSTKPVKAWGLGCSSSCGGSPCKYRAALPASATSGRCQHPLHPNCPLPQPQQQPHVTFAMQGFPFQTL